MEEMTIMQKFADPALFDTLELGDKMIGAGITTLLGMSITFAILIILWGVIAQMQRIFSPKTVVKKTEPVTAAPAAAPVAPVAPLASNVSAGAEVDSSELMAVITAAITAYEAGKEVKSNLIIRKISRVTGGNTAWSAAGSVDSINSRRF